MVREILTDKQKTRLTLYIKICLSYSNYLIQIPNKFQIVKVSSKKRGDWLPMVGIFQKFCLIYLICCIVFCICLMSCSGIQLRSPHNYDIQNKNYSSNVRHTTHIYLSNVNTNLQKLFLMINSGVISLNFNLLQVLEISACDANFESHPITWEHYKNIWSIHILLFGVKMQLFKNFTKEFKLC